MSVLLLALALLSPAQAPICVIPEAARPMLDAKLAKSQAFVFCESNQNPIRRVLPLQGGWLSQAGHPGFKGTSRPGQFLTFQIGVLTRSDVGSVNLSFSSMVGANGSIDKAAARCLSLGGIDLNGKSFRKHLTIGAGRLEPLWCGWDIPRAARGVYRGIATLHLDNQVTKIPIEIDVEGSPVADWGADDPAALTRLRWLDSKAGEGDSITKPFVPLHRMNHSIRILGRDLKIGPTGLPAAIVSHFSSANTHITTDAKAVLALPMAFTVEDGHGSATLANTHFTQRVGGSEAQWIARGEVSGFNADVRGKLDYTGSGQVAIHLTATRDMDLKDIRLDIPYTKAASKFMMGLNRKGGLRPAHHEWTWDTARHQDCFWLGDVNAGLMVRLKDANFHRPLLNIYYSFLPLEMPDSWGNGGKGGVTISEQDGVVLARAYSGPRRVKKGQTLDFIADLYLTPFRTIDTEKQWSTRFVHPHPSREPKPLDDALASADPKKGPNVINVHQATYYNPYINYPYSPDSFAEFTNLVARAHAKGIRARVYYTTREITQNMPELYALHALNGEVVFPGPGKDAKTLINPNGPSPWLVQNLGSDFVPAWVDHVGGKYAADDISVITSPDSRWNNFYLEGLKWMVDRAKIDGVYIDDTALDAGSLRRARRILSVRPDPVIDLHTWNHFNEYAGYANNLNMYMEVLPYLDRLWLGEGFSANDAPWDYWLVEMSGLPFGLMSEMLDSPNVARGLVFGETGRLGWSGDPRPVWQAFDKFGIQGTEMIPFFTPNCPVHSDNPDVLATVYKGKQGTLIALASWAKVPVDIHLRIDWKALGLDPRDCELMQPEIAGLQPSQSLELTQGIRVLPGAGRLLVITPVGQLR